MKEIIVKDSRMYSLVVLYDMHTSYFANVIEGISDTDAHNRLNTKANHVAWLTGSLVQERFEMAKEFDIDKQQTAHELFKNHQGIKENISYPSLTEFKKDWEIISPLLRQELTTTGTEKLDSIFEMPGEDFKWSYFEMFAFMIYREANCIGQIALYRRLMGYEAMKYM